MDLFSIGEMVIDFIPGTEPGTYIQNAGGAPENVACLSVPPKFSIAMTIGYLKGKSAIRIHKEESGREPKGFTNKNFWTRGYCVSTVGLDEKQIREYIQNQEKLEMGEQASLNFGEDLNF
jgi:putative transposase